MAKPHRHDEIEITVLEVGWIDFIAGNDTRDIDIADVAAAAGMHPNSAMRLFRQSCGLLSR